MYIRFRTKKYTLKIEKIWNIGQDRNTHVNMNKRTQSKKIKQDKKTSDHKKYRIVHVLYL